MANLDAAIQNIASGELSRNRSFRGLEMIVENPYRILGLSSIANSVQAQDRVAEITEVVNSGSIFRTPFDFPQLGEVERTSHNCRSAMVKLKFKETEMRLLWFKDSQAIDKYGTREGLAAFFTPLFNTFTLDYDDFLASYICLLNRDPNFTQEDLYLHLFAVINNILILSPEDFAEVYYHEAPNPSQTDPEVLQMSFAAVVLRPLYDAVTLLNLHNPEDLRTLEQLLTLLSKVNSVSMAFIRLKDFIYALFQRWLSDLADTINRENLMPVAQAMELQSAHNKHLHKAYDTITIQIAPVFAKIINNLIPEFNEYNHSMREIFYEKFAQVPALLGKAGYYDKALNITKLLQEFSPGSDQDEILESQQGTFETAMLEQGTPPRDLQPEPSMEYPEYPDYPSQPEEFAPNPIEDLPPAPSQGETQPDIFAAANPEPIDPGTMIAPDVRVKEITPATVMGRQESTGSYIGKRLLTFAVTLGIVGLMGFAVYKTADALLTPTVDKLIEQRTVILEVKDSINQNVTKIADLKTQIEYNKSMYETTGEATYATKYNELVKEYNTLYETYRQEAESFNNDVAKYNRAFS